MLTQNSIVVSTQQKTSQVTGEEVTIVNLKNGTYYGLSGVGTQIWNLLDTPRSISEIQGILLQKFDVEPERCETDVMRILQSLADEGLVEVR